MHLIFHLLFPLNLCRLAKLVEDSGDGELVLSDYSDVIMGVNYEDSVQRVLVLDEFSASRPMFVRDPGLMMAKGSSSRWNAVVAILPRSVAPGFMDVCTKDGLGSCAECSQDVCRVSAHLDRVCMCCLVH